MDYKIKGINLGSWFLIEGYILGGRNISESFFKGRFKDIYGHKELGNFQKLFRDNFIQEEDFHNISLIGANTIRVPFNYRLIEKNPYSYSKEGLAYLDKVFLWARKYNLKIILDLHAAPGAQNCDWHADSSGKALLWKKKENQKRTFSLWQKIVERFKDEEALIGYDVLNEPVLGSAETNVLNKFYKELIKKIRVIDKNKIIFLEGSQWAQKIDFLEDLIGENISISIHTYQPLNYTFNFSSFYRFPGKIDRINWNAQTIYKYLEPYYEFSQKNKVYIFVGEFGINWRGGFWGELDWLTATLSAFTDFNFGYTYWTYKAIANNVFPDGVYQYIPNSKYINREGPVYGWETYLDYWKKEKNSIVDFWKTKNFKPNKQIINTLRRFFKK